MGYNFFIVGGDMRMFYLAKKLVNDNHDVMILGFDKFGHEKLLNNNIKLAHSINEARKNSIFIGSIPLTMDNKTVYTPFSDKIIHLKELEGKSIIAGKIPQNIKGFDILNDENTTIMNAIPTAEGAIAKAIEETTITLNDANILVLGFGRVAKLLCNRLNGFGSNIYVSARKQEDLTWINALNYNAIPLEELDKNLCKMKIVFNTVPDLILGKKRLILLKQDTLIMDLASLNGGVDWKAAKKLKINAIQYLGIPGKIAPNTVADYIKKYIYETIEKE